MTQPKSQETPRKRHRLLKVLVVAFLALPLLVAAAPYILPTGWICSKVSAIVKETTGVELAIESLSLRWTGATVKGITAGDPSGGPRAAEVGLVEADLSLRPLLRGEIVVDRVLVRGATLRMVLRADGTLLLPLPPMPVSAPAAEGESSPLPPVRASVKIEACAARIECEDDPSRSVAIEPVDGTIDVESLDKPVRVSLHAGPAGKGISIAATATIAKDGRIDPEAMTAEATVTIEEFDGNPFARLFAPDLPRGTSAGDVHGTLTATLEGNAAQVEGTFHLHEASWSGAALPAAVVYVTADADLAATSAHLKNLKFATDGFRLQATGEAALGGESLRASGNANIAIDATAIGPWAAGIIPGLEAGGAIDLLLTGSLEGNVAQGRVEAVGRDIRVRGEGIPSAALANFRGTLQGSADLAVERVTFQDTTLTLPFLAVTVEGDWTGFSPQGTGRVAARGTISSLGDLRDALTGLVGEIPTRIAGTGEFSAAVSVGEGGVLDVSSTAALRDVRVTDEAGGTLFTAQAPLTLEEEARIDPVANTIEIRRSLVDFGAGRVTAEGNLASADSTTGASEGRLAANVEIDLGRALSLVRGFVPVPEGYSLEGTATGTATVTGTLERPSVEIAGTMEERIPTGRRRTGITLRAQADLPAERATLETLDVTSGPDTIRASGRVEGFSAQASGNVALSVAIEDIGAWVARVEPILPADLPRASGPVHMTLGAEGGAGVWALKELAADGDLRVVAPALLPGGPWQSGLFRVTATAESVSLDEIQSFDLGAAWADLVVTARASASGLSSGRPTGTGALTVEGSLDGIAPLLAALGIADVSIQGSGPLRVRATGEAAESIAVDLSVDWATPRIVLGAREARVEVAREEATVRARLEAPLNLSRADMPSLEIRSGSLALTGNAALSALSPLPAIEGLHLEGSADLADVATIGPVAASLPPGTVLTGPATFALDARGALDDLRATICAAATDATLTLPETFLKPAGTPLSLEAEVRYRGTEAAIPSFRARFAEADLSGSATISLGEVTVPTEATIRLPETQMTLLAQYLPALADLQPNGAVSMNGTLAPDASGKASAQGILAFHALSMRIPDSTQTVALDGPVTYRLDGSTDLLTSESLAARINDQPATIQVHLTGIARAAKAFLKTPAAPAVTQQEPGAEPVVEDMDLTPLLPPLREVGGSIRIAIPDFELSKNHLTNLRLPVTLDGGRIAITDAGGGFNNGTIAIRMNADVSTDRPTWEFGLDMRDVNVLIENAPTLALINPLLAKIEGAAGQSEFVFSLPVTVLAEGARQSEILRTARTKEDATLRMEEGTIEGSRILQVVGSVIEKEGLLPYHFDGMEANFRVGGGRIDLIRAAFRGNENTIMLSGWTSLVPIEEGNQKGQHAMNQRMGFTGTLAHSDDPIKQKVYDAIFAEGGILMEGTVEFPEYRFDFKDALARIVRDVARDRLRDEAGDRLRDLFRNR